MTRKSLGVAGELSLRDRPVESEMKWVFARGDAESGRAFGAEVFRGCLIYGREVVKERADGNRPEP